MAGKVGGALPAPFVERFWAKVQTGWDCWQWVGALNSSGYGVIHDGKKLVYAHRASYERLTGPIPADFTLDHLCRNHACVNPSHLEPVSSAENNRRGAAVRTHCRNGHERTPENTYTYPKSGVRTCKACIREHQRTHRRKMARVAA